MRCQDRATQTWAWPSQAPRPRETHPRHSHISFHTHAVPDAVTGASKLIQPSLQPTPQGGESFPTGPPTRPGAPPHGPHLALQVGSLEPARVIRVDSLHDGSVEALLLHLLCCPDVGELDEGAFLGMGTGGREACAEVTPLPISGPQSPLLQPPGAGTGDPEDPSSQEPALRSDLSQDRVQAHSTWPLGGLSMPQCPTSLHTPPGQGQTLQLLPTPGSPRKRTFFLS